MLSPKTRVAVVAVLLMILTGPTSMTSATTQSTPVRILLTGDSLTQGAAGDFTWRYRLWQHLAGVPVDFVGPRDDLFDPISQAHGCQLYADPAFDRDHGAVWGAAFHMPGYAPQDLIAGSHPDVVVQTLGINDLVWLHRPPQAVAADAAAFVQAARLADRGVDVVLVPLPHVWYPQVVSYNRLLREVAADLDTVDARVVAADTDRGVVPLVDTYDLFHLASTGEVTFAAAVADALAGLGLGVPPQRPLPEVLNGPRQVAELTVTARVRGARVSWIDPPGASMQYLWLRDATAGRAWRRKPVPLRTGPIVLRGLVGGHRYALRLQAARGSVISELFSRTAWVTPARVTRSPGPAAAPAGSSSTTAAPAAGGGTLRGLVGRDR